LPDELVKPDSKVPGENLNLRQHQAAILEAAGMDGPRIGVLLDLHKKTIERWRREVPEYNEAVKEYESRRVQDLEPIVMRIQLEVAETALKAIRTMNAAMDATTKAGSPAWAARLKAAADALNNSKLISPTTLAPKDSSGGGGGAQFAVIRVEVPEGSTAETQAIEAEVVAPEAREITDA